MPHEEQPPQSANISPPPIRDDGYITEHLGFSPIEFVDDVFNVANDIMYQAVACLEQYLETQVEESEEVEMGLHQIETLLEHNLDKGFDRFELFMLANCLVIPEHIEPLLNHYKGLNFEDTEEDEREIDAHLERTRRDLATARAINRKMTEEFSTTSKRLKDYTRYLDTVDSSTFRVVESEESLTDKITGISQNVNSLTDSIARAKTEMQSNPLFRSVEQERTQDQDLRTLYMNGVISQHKSALKPPDVDRFNDKGDGDRVGKTDASAISDLLKEWVTKSKTRTAEDWRSFGEGLGQLAVAITEQR